MGQQKVIDTSQKLFFLKLNHSQNESTEAIRTKALSHRLKTNGIKNVTVNSGNAFINVAVLKQQIKVHEQFIRVPCCGRCFEQSNIVTNHHNCQKNHETPTKTC